MSKYELLSPALAHSAVSCLQSVIWPSVAPMSLQLWEGYFLRWVQGGAVTASIAERRRIAEIISRNKEAKQEAVRLRREVNQLLEEAVSLGLLRTGEAEDNGEELESEK